jgi:hypothetical protein
MAFMAEMREAIRSGSFRPWLAEQRRRLRGAE